VAFFALVRTDFDFAEAAAGCLLGAAGFLLCAAGFLIGSAGFLLGTKVSVFLNSSSLPESVYAPGPA
jgi:hypothetical protein